MSVMISLRAELLQISLCGMCLCYPCNDICDTFLYPHIASVNCLLFYTIFAKDSLYIFNVKLISYNDDLNVSSYNVRVTQSLYR